MLRRQDHTTPTRRRTPRALLALATLAFAPACVSSSQYDAALARIDKDRTRIVALQASQQGTVRDAQALRQSLEEQAAIARALRAELGMLDEDASKLVVEKGELALRLEAAKVRLALIQRAQRAAEARAALFQDVALKLKKMVDSGELSVFVRDGRMVIALPNDVLFDTAHVDIKPNGRAALKEVATVLQTLTGRHFQVAGHTDDVPISTTRYPSNWELSSGRALEVTRFLIGQGMRSEMLSAAAYGEHDPVANNATPQGRAKNRRIEITLVPEIDELVNVPAAP